MTQQSFLSKMASSKIQASSQSINDVFEKHHQALMSGLKSHLGVVVQEASGELLGDDLKARLLDETICLSQRIEELLARVKEASRKPNFLIDFVVILKSVELHGVANKLLEDYWSIQSPEASIEEREEVPVKSKPLSNISCSEVSYSNEEPWANYSLQPHQESLVSCVTEQSPGNSTLAINIFSPDSLHGNEANNASSMDAVVLQSPPHALSGSIAPLEENMNPSGIDELVFGQLMYSEQESRLYENLHKAHNELTNTLKRGQGHREELERTRKRYKKKLKDMEKFYQTKYSHVTKALEQECAQRTQDVTQLEQEKESLKANIKDQCEIGAKQSDKIKQQEELLKQTTKEVATLRKKCADKEKLCAQLEQKLKQARQEFEELKEELKQKEQDVKKLSIPRALLSKEDLEKCLDACTEMHELANSLESSLDEDQLQSLNRQLESKMLQLKTQRRLSQSWPRL